MGRVKLEDALGLVSCYLWVRTFEENEGHPKRKSQLCFRGGGTDFLSEHQFFDIFQIPFLTETIDISKKRAPLQRHSSTVQNRSKLVDNITSAILGIYRMERERYSHVKFLK